MNKQLERMLDDAEGRWFSDIEAEKLLGYADGLVARLEIHRAVESAEEAILDDVYATVMKRYEKDIAAQHGELGPAKMKRDSLLVLRYAAMAMVLRDPDFMVDKLAVWARTILFALSDPERVTDTMRILHGACERHLSADDAAELLPYVKIVVDEFEMGGVSRAERKAA